MLTRRQFLRSTARVASSATVTLLITQLGCSSGDDDGTTTSTTPTTPPPPACDGVSSTSSVVENHTHSVCVPASDLSSPPVGGVSLTTTLTNGHTHELVLTGFQLAAIQNGDTVTMVTSIDQSHLHSFSIQRA